MRESDFNVEPKIKDWKKYTLLSRIKSDEHVYQDIESAYAAYDEAYEEMKYWGLSLYNIQKMDEAVICIARTIIQAIDKVDCEKESDIDLFLTRFNLAEYNSFLKNKEECHPMNHLILFLRSMGQNRNQYYLGQSEVYKKIELPNISDMYRSLSGIKKEPF